MGPLADGQILLLSPALAELHGQPRCSPLGLGKDHEPRGVHVEAVDDERGCAQVAVRTSKKGAALVPATGGRRDAMRLVQRHQVLVLRVMMG